MQPTVEEVCAMCTSALPTWKGATPDSLHIENLQGLSNIVLFVTSTRSDCVPNKVLLRVFPPHERAVVRKDQERAIFSLLATSHQGTKLYYECETYRVEEYLDARKLNIFELGNRLTMKTIARLVCDFHRNRSLVRLLETWGPRVTFAQNFLQDWLEKYRTNFKTYLAATQFAEQLAIMAKLQYFTMPQFEAEYRTILGSFSKSEIVVGHNDVHEMNILRPNFKKTDLRLIDYEYTSYNYRAMDIATLWIETTIDYTHSTYPFFAVYQENKWDQTELSYFVRAYLEREAEVRGIVQTEEQLNVQLSILLAEVHRAEPLLHAIWTVWTILVIDWTHYNQATTYHFPYALFRFNQYEKTKEAVLKELEFATTT